MKNYVQFDKFEYKINSRYVTYPTIDFKTKNKITKTMRVITIE